MPIKPSEYPNESLRLKTARDLEEVERVVNHICAEVFKSCPPEHHNFRFLIDKAKENGFLILREAIYERKVEVSKFMMYRSAVNNPFNDVFRTPLFYAAHTNDRTIIYELLTRGAYVNYKDIGGITALHCAVSFSSICAVSELLKSPHIDVNMQDKEGSSALHYAASTSSHDVLMLLLKYKGINVSLQDFTGQTALHVAIANRQLNTVLSILNHTGIDVNIQDQHGYTALHLATMKGLDELAYYLTQHPGTDFSIKDNKQNTVLHYAVENCHAKIVRLLLNLGTDVNCRNLRNRTAIVLAAYGSEPDIVQILLDYGADGVFAKPLLKGYPDNWQPNTIWLYLRSIQYTYQQEKAYFEDRGGSPDFLDLDDGEEYSETLAVLFDHMVVEQCFDDSLPIKRGLNVRDTEFYEYSVRLCKEELEVLKNTRLDQSCSLSCYDMLNLKYNNLRVLITNDVFRNFFESKGYQKFSFFQLRLAAQYDAAERRDMLLREAETHFLNLFSTFSTSLFPDLVCNAITQDLSEADLWNFNFTCGLNGSLSYIDDI